MGAWVCGCAMVQKRCLEKWLVIWENGDGCFVQYTGARPRAGRDGLGFLGGLVYFWSTRV